MGNKKAEQVLKQRIDQLMKEKRDPHRVIALLEANEGCEVNTAEYGWSEVKRGDATVPYPFSL